MNTACTGTCTPNVHGATCVTTSLTAVKGHFNFQCKFPKADFSDWDAVSWCVSDGFLVASVHDGKYVDATTTDADGNFTVKVVDVAKDTVSVIAMGEDESGKTALVVGNPQLAPGKHEAGTLGQKPNIWSWTWTASSIVTEPRIGVDIAHGAPGAFVFANAWGIWRTRAAELGTNPGTIALWVAADVSWSCTACQWQERVSFSGISVDTQIVVAGGPDEGYWSEAVIGHEMGHFIMASFSVPTNEGGKHMPTVATMPGQAWSEGWATYHQAAYYDAPRFVDKQQGGMFWMSIDQRSYSSGAKWGRAVPSGGLLQRMEENEVAAMLWTLHTSSSSAPRAIIKALGSPRMKVAPFLRGYTRHTWNVTADYQLVDITDLGTSTPCFADMLDALVCQGFPAASVDAATDPLNHFPYPSNAPLCR